MKFIRKILVKSLGLKGYLRLVSTTYIKMIGMGMMKKKYAELFFVKKVVKAGDVVLDIGANLGYYSTVMSKAAGTTGQLYAVEPIPLFAEVWKKNMAGYKKYEAKLFNCALGDTAKERVKMSIPIVNGIVRHGLTKVVEEENKMESVLSFDVPMHVGDDLLQSEAINRLDFIKCDVEGYEQYVIPSLEKLIKQYKPILQIELSGEDNKVSVIDFLLNLSYKIFILKGEKLEAIQKKDIFSIHQDFYFIHADEIETKRYLIHN